jgi:hypothetical protein
VLTPKDQASASMLRLYGGRARLQSADRPGLSFSDDIIGRSDRPRDAITQCVIERHHHRKPDEET